MDRRLELASFPNMLPLPHPHTAPAPQSLAVSTARARILPPLGARRRHGAAGADARHPAPATYRRDPAAAHTPPARPPHLDIYSRRKPHHREGVGGCCAEPQPHDATGGGAIVLVVHSPLTISTRIKITQGWRPSLQPLAEGPCGELESSRRAEATGDLRRGSGWTRERA